MIVKFKKRFDKSYQKLGIKIQNKFKEKLRLFSGNPLDKTLDNYLLNGEYK